MLAVNSQPVNAKILHSEKSLYRNIIVEQKGNKRCMVFGRMSRHPDKQSCIDMSNPEYLVFSYTKLVMASLDIQPNPNSILIIGLGGGTLPVSYESLYPTALIDTVEIDEAVVKVAEKWFKYKQTDKQKVALVDGRVFVKRQIRRNKQYDLVILDAFNGDYIPEHLMTEEFLTEIKQLLTANGLLVANTFSKNKLYDSESVTYQKVFGDFSYIHSVTSGNRIIYAQTHNNEIKLNALKNNQVIKKLEEIGVDLDEFRDRMRSRPDWDQTARPLTDQYSPANLLNQ